MVGTDAGEAYKDYDKATPQEEVVSRIRRLSIEAWESAVELPDIHRWLENFKGEVLDVETERENMLHLLAHFNYFGIREIRELLRSIYRDLYRYPIIQSIRLNNANTLDSKLVEQQFQKSLDRTRFLGMGNPSESGAHLLYYFRQENQLRKKLFIHQHEILDRSPGSSDAKIAIEDLSHLVFIDDLLGSGNQARTYTNRLLRSVREAAERENRTLKISYYTLFAKPAGLNIARGPDCSFDEVMAVHEVPDAEEAFHEKSRIYRSKDTTATQREDAKCVAEHYGARIFPEAPLGFGDGQMMLGLHHNVPNNTLPVFWVDETDASWTPIFPRYQKVY